MFLPPRVDTADASPGSRHGTRVLTPEAFRFVGYGSQDSHFRAGSRVLAAFDHAPSATAHRNVTYTPAKLGKADSRGALYDESGSILPGSRLIRGLRDEPASHDAPSIPITSGMKTLKGRYLYIGRLMPHYGHFITETLAKWWPLATNEPFDGYVVHLHDVRMLDWPYVTAFLAAAGIERSKLVFSCNGPLRIEEIVLPQSSIQLESHVFRHFRLTCLHLARTLGVASAQPSNQPLYVSRMALKKGVYRYSGEGLIEDFMRKKGARIVYPETMTLREQYAAFTQHSRIFGVTGSAMHNVVFAEGPREVVYLGPNWINLTCCLIDSVSDVTSTYVRATTWNDPIISLKERIEKRLAFATRGRTMRFHRHRALDYRRVTRWLSAHL